MNREEGYKQSRKQRIDALQRRLDWLDSKLTQEHGNSYLQAEREATYWAIEVLSALVECHSLPYAIEREKRLQAEAQQDAAVGR